MRQISTFLLATTLVAATGILAADVLFELKTPLERPSLLIIVTALAVLTWQLHSARQKLFRRAMESYVQRETLRNLEVELRSQKAKNRVLDSSDSHPMHLIAQ